MKCVVVNCLMALMHEEPSEDTPVLFRYPGLSEVEIIPDIEIEGWYAVRLPKNLIGFCQKEFLVERAVSSSESL